jgi:hypothetical protein
MQANDGPAAASPAAKRPNRAGWNPRVTSSQQNVKECSSGSSKQHTPDQRRPRVANLGIHALRWPRSTRRPRGPRRHGTTAGVGALRNGAVSAHTGDGIDALRRRMVELAAPTDTAIDVVIPYDRGDLVSRVHADGQVQQTEHNSDGTRIKARVPVALAASLREFSAT